MIIVKPPLGVKELSLVFEKAPFSKGFSSTQKRIANIFKFLWFEEHFQMLRFHDELVWMVGLTVEIKLCFQISLAYCGHCLKLDFMVNVNLPYFSKPLIDVNVFLQAMYGDLMLADGQYGGSKGRRWKVDWNRTPQPIQIKLKCLRGVKDKLPG